MVAATMPSGDTLPSPSSATVQLPITSSRDFHSQTENTIYLTAAHGRHRWHLDPRGPAPQIYAKTKGFDRVLIGSATFSAQKNIPVL